MGVASISLEDIDIAHRVPARNDSKHKPIICKFSRRITKDQVMNCRRNINKVSPNIVGFPSDAQLSEARIYEHLTPSLQKLLFEQKHFSNNTRTSSVGLITRKFFYESMMIPERL